MARWERLLPLTGVLAAVLTVAGFIIAGSTPDFVDDPQKIAAYYADESGRVIAAAYVGMLGTAAFIWFVGVLRSRLRVAEGGSGRLSAIAFAGGIVAAAPFLAFDGLNFAAGVRADEDGQINAQVASALWDMSSSSSFAAGLALSVLVLATAALILRTRVFPAWLGWISVLLGIALLTPWAWAALGVFLLWLVVVSVLLYMHPALGEMGELTPHERITG